MLHITNGSSVQLREAVGGQVVFWNDVLHEGPVPAQLPLEELSAVRAEFIAESFDEPDETVQLAFKERDGALEDFRDHEEVVLWFEHDLYDQLQLVQLLDYFAAQELGETRLSLVQSDTYLGPMRPEQLAPLFDRREAVTPHQLNVGANAWTAFRAPDPGGMTSLLSTDISALPYLAPAFRRHLEQFPAATNGLSRTERQLLDLVAGGTETLSEAFRADQKLEDAMFMGDSPYLWHVQSIARGERPLITLEGPSKRLGANVYISEAGREVRALRADHVRWNGIDRWLGGVHLAGRDSVWRWDGIQLVILPTL